MREQHWVVVTSVNAVEHFMGALRDARALGPVQVAAVGPATADALRRTGVEPDLVPAEHSARGLVAAFPDAVGAGPQRVLFPCADLAPDTIPEGLGEEGVGRPPGGGLPDGAGRGAGARAAGPGDGRRRRHLHRPLVGARRSSPCATADGAPVPPPAHVVCIGPTTAAAARAAGLDGVHEALDASAEGIVDELVAHWGPGGGDGS